MKKNISTCLLLLFLVLYSNIPAQQLPQDEKLRTGKLANGLTYYIRHNTLPEQRADFYIAQKVGSIQEEENQRGLAHFLEHMAFGCLKNFPDYSLSNYLQNNGLKIGENLNAYTAIDETVYFIRNVPTTRQGLMDSCLLILHDWSNYILLEDEKIEKERGVIREEWRTGSNAIMRMYEKVLPEIYGDNRYGHRLTIGLISVIDNFSYQDLKDYYYKWYRPDLQGIIIVGDFNVDWMENKIKTIFSDIPAPVNPAERIYYPVADNSDPIVSIATDAEATTSLLAIYNKYDAFPEENKNSPDYYVLKYFRELIAGMINTRLGEIEQKPDAPFVSAGAFEDIFSLSKTKGAFISYANCKEGNVEQTLRLLVQESERVKRYGFTQTEYDRARANFLKGIENSYNERDKERNSTYTNAYVRLFLDKEPAPGIEFEYWFFNEIAGKIPVNAINEYIGSLIAGTNVVITLMMPEKEGLAVPSKEELLSAYLQAKADSISPYTDKIVDTKLINKLPKAGKVKKKTKSIFGTTEWTLSNGHKVIFKQTDFKKDQILMKAISFGGESLLDEKDMPTIHLLNDLIKLDGVGDFSKTDMSKALAGKIVSVSPAINMRSEELNGSCSPADFETMMQLVYLYFTQPRCIDNDAFEAYLSRKKAELKNTERNPFTTFIDSVNNMVYDKHPRKKRMQYDMLEKVDYQLAMKMYRERFMNADRFTFTFVGNINPDSVQNIVEQYLGALPKTKAKEYFKDVKLYPAKGTKNNSFDRQMEIPKSTVLAFYSGKCDYTLRNRILSDILSQILDNIYFAKVRGEESGTYAVSVDSELNKFPYPFFYLHIMFDTHPEMAKKLLKVIYSEIDNIIENGVRESDFNKVTEFMLKKINESKAENSFWQDAIEEFIFTTLDLATDYETTLNQITPEDVKNFAAGIFGQGNKIEVIMNPE